MTSFVYDTGLVQPGTTQPNQILLVDATTLMTLARSDLARGFGTSALDTLNLYDDAGRRDATYLYDDAQRVDFVTLYDDANRVDYQQAIDDAGHLTQQWQYDDGQRLDYVWTFDAAGRVAIPPHPPHTLLRGCNKTRVNPEGAAAFSC